MERQMGVATGPVCRIVWMALRQPVLSEERCFEILREAGHWPRSEPPLSMITLSNVPRGLNEEQTELFLREHGHVVFSGAGPNAEKRAKEEFVAKYGLVLNEDDGFDRSPVIDIGPAGWRDRPGMGEPEI